MLHKCSTDCIWKGLQPLRDLQGHSRSLPLLPFDRPSYDFLLVFHCKYISVLHRFRDINTHLPKNLYVTWPRPRRLGGQFVITRLIVLGPTRRAGLSTRLTRLQPRAPTTAGGPRFLKATIQSWEFHSAGRRFNTAILKLVLFYCSKCRKT